MTLQKKSSIVVMGGSFNPPTIAHLGLMEAAIRAVGAEKGVFVPVGEPYLKRKMRRQEDHIRLSERMRTRMLSAMCSGRENLTVSELEIQNPLLFTKDTMGILQQQNPAAKLYFVAGADKLAVLRSLAAKTDFFEHFGVVLFSREGMDIESLIRQDECFAPFGHAFVHARQPEGMDGISSTAVRRLILSRETEKARAYLHGDVWEMMRHLTPEDFPPEIERFRDEYAFLSNSYPSPILYDGLSFSCAESAFQAARCPLIADKKRISQGDGSRAKMIASRIEPVLGWDERKLAVMEDILRAKFTLHPELARKLMDTGNAVLINCASNKDRFWSRDLYTDQGENHLGRLLMKLRSEFLSEMEDERK